MIKKNAVVLLGSIRDGEYEALVAHGYRLFVVMDSKASLKQAETTKLDLVAYFDFASGTNGLRELLINSFPMEEVIAILNLREYHVLHYLAVSDLVNTSSVSATAAKMSLDKFAMRQAFRNGLARDRSPAFAEVSSLEEALKFAGNHSYPLVLKPVDLYGSLFVRKVHTKRELIINFIEIYKNLKARCPNKPARMQAEVFMTGSNHSVECIVDSNGHVSVTPVVDVLTGRDIGRSDFHHFARWAPSRLTDAQQKDVQQLAREACKAMALTATIAHVECIVTAEGPMILELAVRPGGHRVRLLNEVFGINILEAYALALQNKPFDISIKKCDPLGIVTPFPAEVMVFEGICNEGVIRNLESFQALKLFTTPGSTIGDAASGYFSPAQIDLRAPDKTTIFFDIERLASCSDFFKTSAPKLAVNSL